MAYVRRAALRSILKSRPRYTDEVTDASVDINRGGKPAAVITMQYIPDISPLISMTR